MDDERRGDSSADMKALLGLCAGEGLRRMNRWWIAGGVAAVLVVIGIAVRVFGGPPAASYRQAEVTRGGLIATVTATGTLQPVNTVDIGPEISGQIETVKVDFNDRVTAGQILAVMDTDMLVGCLSGATRLAA